MTPLNQVMFKDKLTEFVDYNTVHGSSTIIAGVDRGENFEILQRPQVNVTIQSIKNTIGDESYSFVIEQADDLAFTVNSEQLGIETIIGPTAVVQRLNFNIQSINRRYSRIRTVISGTVPTVTFGAHWTANY